MTRPSASTSLKTRPQSGSTQAERLSGHQGHRSTQHHRSDDREFVMSGAAAVSAGGASTQYRGRKDVRHDGTRQSRRRTVLLAGPGGGRCRKRERPFTRTVRLDVARAGGKWRQFHPLAAHRATISARFINWRTSSSRKASRHIGRPMSGWTMWTIRPARRMLGGTVIVHPFVVSGVARIALIPGFGRRASSVCGSRSRGN